MTEYGFKDRLNFSKGTLGASPMETIKELIPDCVGVRLASATEDRNGIDYIAQLRSGVEYWIDLKTRDIGCSRYWKQSKDPEEVTLERWSEYYGEKHPRNKIGWTLDVRKKTHYILFTFDPQDSCFVFLVNFLQLRNAFLRYGAKWKETYGKHVAFINEDIRAKHEDDCWHWQWTPHVNGGGHKSASIFVPALEVLAAISKVSVGLARVSANGQ